MKGLNVEKSSYTIASRRSVAGLRLAGQNNVLKHYYSGSPQKKQSPRKEKGIYSRSANHRGHGEPVIIDDGHRTVSAGILYPNGDFVKTNVKPSHILQKPKAIALQADAVRQLDIKGCRTIFVEVTDGRKLSTSFDTLKKYGRLINRGFGDQIALLLTYWKDNNSGQCEMFGGEI